MTLVKICGLSTRATVDAAVGAGASHLGFVFFAASPRDVAPDAALALGHGLPVHVVRVGVFVDPDDALLDRAAPAIDVIQLHGGMGPERIAAVRARFGRPVWRAAGVASRADIDAARSAAGSADRLLFDAKAPTGSAIPGGNGVRFDWTLLAGIDVGREWGLSGGLDAATVGDAIRLARPPLVDVSSGVEDSPGVKSVGKIVAFVAAARAA